MIEAWPKGWMSTGYEIVEGEERLGSLDYELITPAYEAELTIGSVRYRAYCSWKREGFISIQPEHIFYLEGPNGVVAASQPWGKWPLRKYHIFFDGQEYVLKWHGTWSFFNVYSTGKFSFKRGEKQLGVIRVGGFLCRRYKVELADEIPLLVQLFALYLADVITNYSPVRLCYCLRSK